MFPNTFIFCLFSKTFRFCSINFSLPGCTANCNINHLKTWIYHIWKILFSTVCKVKPLLFNPPAFLISPFYLAHLNKMQNILSAYSQNKCDSCGKWRMDLQKVHKRDTRTLGHCSHMEGQAEVN